FVPITHYLVHAATVHTARQVAHLLDEVTKERRAWPKFQMVDVAIQGLVHSIDELCHGTESPPQVLQNTLSRRSDVPWMAAAESLGLRNASPAMTCWRAGANLCRSLSPRSLRANPLKPSRR